MRTNNGTQRGGALLTVLWMSAVLATIGLSVAARIRNETDHAANAADGLRAHYLATGSVDRAIQWILWGPPRWRPNTPRLAMSYPGGDAIVELIPESSKLNVNRATLDDLMRVIASVTGDPARARDLSAAIIARRTRSGGPGLSFSPGGPTFPSSSASFEEIEELLFVPGMTPEVFYGNYVTDLRGRVTPRGGLRDSLSVWGSTGPFDVNTVSPAVLEAIGMQPFAIDQLVRRRTAQPFARLDEIAALGIPMQRLKLGGDTVWTLRATARLRRPDGTPSETVRSASAVIKYWQDVRYSLDSIHVLRYYDDAWSPSAIAPPGVPLQ